MKSAPCFESLAGTTVSNNTVCMATPEGCDVRMELAQLVFQGCYSINIVCILTIDVTASNVVSTVFERLALW